MDAFFAGMDCRLRVSITDSIMMSILHSAMDKAHEKVKSKDGDIGRLNEITKFYELAIMQLEGCLKFVEEETDNCIPESSHEKMLQDVKEIRDRLQGRLKETEFALSEKDRELTERLENELKFRQALELKEEELISLRTDLEVEKTKSDGLQEFILSNRISGDENREGELCELKNNVDQRVWNIKQKLEDERMNITSGMRKVNQAPSTLVNFEADSGLGNKEQGWPIQSNEIEHCEKVNDNESELPNYSIRPEANIGFDQMSLELESLREALDVTFGKMQNAIFLSEVGTIEQQWMWTIEKDTISVLTKGFIRDSGESFEGEIRTCKNQVSLFFLSEQWADLVNDITILRDELLPLVGQNDVQIKSTNHHESLAPSSQINIGVKISQHARENCLPECKIYGKPDYSSSNVEELDHVEKALEEDLEGKGSHLVAKMIKSHECIIRKKLEELNFMKGEILREKGLPCHRRDDGPKRRIEEVIAKLNNLIKWNSGLGETFDDHFSVHGEHNFPGKSLRLDITDQLEMGVDASEAVLEKVGNNAVSRSRNGELQTEIKKLKQDAEDLAFQSMITEATNVILFKGLMKEFYIKFYNHGAETLIREGVCQDILREMVIDWNKNLESSEAENQIREEICNIIFNEAVKDWTKNLESRVAETQIREEICHIIFNDAVKDFGCTYAFALAKYHDAKADIDRLEDSASTNLLLHNLEGKIREDIYAVFIMEMIEEWNKVIESFMSESLLGEDIHWIVFDETIKGIADTSNSSLRQQQGVKVLENSRCNLTFTNELSQSFEVLVKEDICMVIFKEMIQNWRMDIDAYNIRSLIEEDIYKYIIAEAIKDAHTFSRGSEDRNPENFPQDLFSAGKLYGSQEERGDGSLMQTLNSLLKSFYMEEDLMLSAGSKLKEHNAYINLVALRCGWLKWDYLFEELLTKEESMISSVINKIQKTLQQLIISKELLVNLGSSLGIDVGNLVKVLDQMIPSEVVGLDETFSCPPKETQSDPSDFVFSNLIGFPQLLVDFEDAVNKKLGTNALRYLDF